MELTERLQFLVEEFDAVRNRSRTSTGGHPALHSASLSLKRVLRILKRPFRIAVLGESNAGKSTIANMIAGATALPVLPVANTRLPTFLRYAAAPHVAALDESGQIVPLSHSDESIPGNIRSLEVGLPSEGLRDIEVLDMPGTANPLLPSDFTAMMQLGIDAAIWATVATQAWRETERMTWLRLPQRIRRHGILATTHCDLIRSEDDFAKLRARMQEVQKAHFTAVCFVATKANQDASMQPSTANLIAEVKRAAHAFKMERTAKAATIARRIASRVLAIIETTA